MIFRMSNMWRYSNFRRLRPCKKFMSTVGGKQDVGELMAPAYNPCEVEKKWYPWWEKNNFFRRDNVNNCFVMILPPPNVTGTLHLGHALTCSVQDAIARWHQMCGKEVVWIPGCDHAGIATQAVVERHLWAKSKITKHDLGRERFVAEVWKWKEEKGSTIYDQMRQLGVSIDWDRAAFTMDPHMNKAVTEAFIRLHDQGLIYRSNSLVNWCCSLQSAISDIEVEHLTLTEPTDVRVPGFQHPVTFGKMYDFAYQVIGSDKEVVVSTTRPETMLGDTAVMVHPDDSRYQELIGSQVMHPFRKEPIPVIADSHVDYNIGTGAVKVTPAHDQNDFMVGKRHSLVELNIFDDEGHICDSVSEFEGMHRFDARKAILEGLSKLGLNRGSKDHAMVLPVCSRTRDVIEPRLKPQWFINCQEMAAEALKVVEGGELQLFPEEHKVKWRSWLENVRDWCVSRQLWWGHRIPMYKVISSSGSCVWVAAKNKKDAQEKAANEQGITKIENIIQDEDVLDTWFSSGLFPFAVLGWPQSTEDMARLFPTSLLETGHDILFFWVARMVMLSIQLTGQLPFKEVLLHGLVCDASGHKMSKSKGNVIDPNDVIKGASLQTLTERLELSSANGVLTSEEKLVAQAGQVASFPKGIPQCGADALRFTLCSSDIKNQLIGIDVLQMEQSKFLGNKIWQTVRFLLKNIEITGLQNCAAPLVPEERSRLGLMDKWILSCLANTVREANAGFLSYDLHKATAAFTHFWYKQLCEVYLECIKPYLQEGEKEEQKNCIQTLWMCVDTGIKLLSPFMPYLTEELYQKLPNKAKKFKSVMETEYPKEISFKGWLDEGIQKHVEIGLQVAARLRQLKASYNITHTQVKGSVVCKDTATKELLECMVSSLKTLGRVHNLSLVTGATHTPSGTATAMVSHNISVQLHLEGFVDPKKEVQRLEKKLLKLEKERMKLEKMMNTSGYQNKSPEHVKEMHIEKVKSLQLQISEIRELIVNFTTIY
ncbi:valine--tRNA ligase-like [Oratosquilla oratoria]|uniref:valine--tRNA ligase-like n=1 Tax=Oratosquilla oratoria TaxID=337810 RepID=UPI003F774810